MAHARIVISHTTSYGVCWKATCTGAEKFDVVQLSHKKLAEITGDAKRNTRSSDLQEHTLSSECIQCGMSNSSIGATKLWKHQGL